MFKRGIPLKMPSMMSVCAKSHKEHAARCKEAVSIGLCLLASSMVSETHPVMRQPRVSDISIQVPA